MASLLAPSKKYSQPLGCGAKQATQNVPGQAAPLHTLTARNKRNCRLVTGAKKLALLCESNSPIKLKLVEEETDLKAPGGQERDGGWTPNQGEAH